MAAQRVLAAVAEDLLHKIPEPNKHHLFFMNTQNALIIFVRNPVLGKVKTRLAASMGDEKALAVYKYLLQHTKNITENLPVTKFVFYAGEINNNDIWNGYQKQLQYGNDLGERMANAFKELFKNGFKKICVIGSDCLELDTEILNAAFTALSNTDIIIGPATDGGYYLLGMKKDCTVVFTKNNWGESSVYDTTIAIIKENNLQYLPLKMLNDVDTAEDLPTGILIDKTI